MKQCNNCQNEFEPKHSTRGHEQLYCSIKCRTEAYKKRVMEKVKSNENQETEAKNNIGEAYIQRSDNRINPMGNNIPNVNLEILEGKYQAKTEALEYKLRYEQSQKELENLRIKVMELENELEEYDNDDSDYSTGGFMGSILEVSKNSPEFANAIGKLLQNESIQNLIGSLFPKNSQN